MDAYISPPSKKINLRYHTHLSIKAHCGNQPLRESLKIAGFLIFTPWEPPPTFYHRWSEGCSRNDGVTPEMSKKTEASTLNFLSLISVSQGKPDAMFQGHSASGGFYTVNIRSKLTITWVTLEALFTQGVCEHAGVPGAQICDSVEGSNAADRGEG